MLQKQELNLGRSMPGNEQLDSPLPKVKIIPADYAAQSLLLVGCQTVLQLAAESPRDEASHPPSCRFCHPTAQSVAHCEF